MAENEELQEEMSEGETRQKILVADDEASIRRILETRLKMVGYDVVTAEDGEEAVEVFNKTNPDLVVLDVMMPKMDGYGVTREIRRTSDVPIIILTALGAFVFFTHSLILTKSIDLSAKIRLFSLHCLFGLTCNLCRSRLFNNTSICDRQTVHAHI